MNYEKGEEMNHGWTRMGGTGRCVYLQRTQKGGEEELTTITESTKEGRGRGNGRKGIGSRLCLSFCGGSGRVRGN